jgi:hypothetical protein
VRDQSADHGPIEAKHHDLMNALAHGVDKVLNGDCAPAERKVGFFMAVFDFGTEPHPGQRFNYISNANGLDVLATLKDVVARLEGRYSTPGKA